MLGFARLNAYDPKNLTACRLKFQLEPGHAVMDNFDYDLDLTIVMTARNDQFSGIQTADRLQTSLYYLNEQVKKFGIQVDIVF
jgi:hypothetical protein